jgi:hypothetical protein
VSNFKWKIFSNFVAFSEYPNFTLDCSFSRFVNKSCIKDFFSLLFSGALQDDWSFLWFNIVPEGVQWSFACVLFLSGEFPIFSLVF